MCGEVMDGNDAKKNVYARRSQAFAEKLRSEFTQPANARFVFEVEKTLGNGAVAGQLSEDGRRLLLRALDLERKARLRSARES